MCCVVYLREGDTLKVSSIDRLAHWVISESSLAKSAIVKFLAEGIALARNAGKYKGSKENSHPSVSSTGSRMCRCWGKKTVLAGELEVRRSTIYLELEKK